MKIILAFLVAILALVSGQTVEQSVFNGCSTTLVNGLSRQLIEEMNCMRSGLMTTWVGRSNRIINSASTFAFAQAGATNALLNAVAQRPGVNLNVNSAFRTLAQQYLLWRWGDLGRCGITTVAAPGRSNHNGGLAIDIQDNAGWRRFFEANNWRWFGTRDPVHFDFVGASVDIRSISVQAFQRLWNRNNPNDQIGVDGAYGPQTQARLQRSPAAGFRLGAQCRNTVSCSVGNTLGVCQPAAQCNAFNGTIEIGGSCADDEVCCSGGPGTPDVDFCRVSSTVVGTCQDVSTCAYASFPGHCSGPNNIQCCANAAPAVSNQKTNQAGIDLIKSFEGWFPNFYTDPVGIKTIGYGHACHVNDCNNLQALRTTGTWYKATAPLSLQEGDDLLRGDLQGRGYESCVRGALTRTVSDNQFAALVSFTFNVGCGALKSSTLLTRVNNNAAASSIRDAFLMWVKAGGQVLQGLVRRRNAEADLYLSTISAPVNTNGVGTRCYKNGKQGICLTTDTCHGNRVAGLCPGPADVQCCFDATCSVGGTSGMCIPRAVCKNTPTAGLCPGPADIQCCTSLPAEVPSSMPCPEGTTWDADKLLCIGSEKAYGIFTPEEIEACIRTHGISVCTRRHFVEVISEIFDQEKRSLIRSYVSLALTPLDVPTALQVRGLGVDGCPLGTSRSQNFEGFCVQSYIALDPSGNSFTGENIWGPFSPELVSHCNATGGGLACFTPRWGSGFFKTVSLARSFSAISSVEDDCSLETEEYCGDSTNEYISDQELLNLELQTEHYESSAMTLVPSFLFVCFLSLFF